ncbi:hypothetical protein MF271_13465 [Deinococcus sp. KNUC1210]|uniref:hypothetical protein n=1 Tax=Deinococcus sp. KNUC1210 TaxID=2917691 RepID=UPI001EEFA686|nr:hypothetical protein [Deinococcus sp. KNUC1210]ULH14965.1 hypothetical protein MF271_13465 [Deinococcus sp. KNUC1210]
MKKSLSFLSLMVALAAGAASATGTTAGTTIVNIATINYSDDTGTVQPPVDSPRQDRRVAGAQLHHHA